MALRPDPQEIAFWRYEQIEEALPEGLSKRARGKILREISRTPVRSPSGATKRISLAALYRWIQRYRMAGLEGLEPRARADKGRPRRLLPQEVIQEALRLLGKDPEMSFPFLWATLKAHFAKKNITISASTLRRRLAAETAYGELMRAAREKRRRVRFVAKEPHDIWQTDAKGPTSVVLSSGERLPFHIFSILDDATRAVLAALIALHPDLAAAVLVFRRAVLRWGLPRKIYADRASIFDSKPFRMGLAMLGTHRIRSRPRNAPARGKIEAYHRVLANWFTGRLHAQKVLGLAHIQELLDGVIYSLYQPHKHRSIHTPPEKALAGKVSPRSVPPSRLYEAFRQEKCLKAHPVTGEVVIENTTYLVPDPFRGFKLRFLLDPPGELPPLLLDPHSSRSVPLRRAAVKPEDIPSPSHEKLWGEGPLQTIYDHWRGHTRPLSEPGFGLPEIYALLAKVAARHVPQNDIEAAFVQRFYSKIGPLPRAATEAAFNSIGVELGPGRPVKTYLEALQRLVERRTS